MSDDIIWLVKSGGRILGPVSETRIGEMLRTREVSVLDEVSAPVKRWQTIQYHPEFRDLIELLRKNNLGENTDPTWTPNSGTGTSNMTQSMTDNMLSDLTEEVTNDLSGFTNTSKEIVIHNLEEQTGRTAPANNAGRFQTSQNQHTAVQQKVEKTTRGMWIATILVLLLVVAVVLQKRMGSSVSGGHLSTQSLKQAVMANVGTGQYQEALRLLKLNLPDNAPAGDLSIYYGSLLIQVEGQTTTGRRMLNGVVAAHRGDLKQAYTGIGIADLIDGQLGSAQENFDKAIAIDGAYIPAILNSATLAMQRGDYERSKALAIKALQLNPQQGEALLTLAQAALYIYKGRGNSAELNQPYAMIREYLVHGWDFVSELGFFEVYFDFLKKDHGLDDQIKNYLDRDPNLTSDHRHNVFIYRGHTQWKVLSRFCEQMVDKLGSGSRSANLMASCYSHEGRWDLARNMIEKAVQQMPKDGLAQAWLSYILQEGGDAAEGSVVLARANELNRHNEYILPLLLQARWCQSKQDFDCARESWQKIYEREVDFLPAISGLAWCQAAKGSTGEAFRLTEKGFKISNDYIPLLLLRQKGEKEGWYATN